MSLKEFDDLLRETVIHRSTLSNTRVERISYICSKNLRMGSQHMASSILEAHKDKKAKRVSSLYTLHALVQQAHKAIKRGSRDSGDWEHFLSSIESVLVDFFDESIKYLDAELKEKNLKILKMWSQMAVFNKPLLEILMEKTSTGGKDTDSLSNGGRRSSITRNHSDSDKTVSEKDSARLAGGNDAHKDGNGGLPANILSFLSNMPSSERDRSHTPSDSGALKRDRSYERYDDRYDDRDRGRSTRPSYDSSRGSAHADESNKRLRVDPRTKRPIEVSRDSGSQSHAQSQSYLHSQSHSHSPSIRLAPQEHSSMTPSNEDSAYSHSHNHSHSNNKSVDALANFDWAAFDPTQPHSWILAGKAFEKTFGFVPSNEQIGSCAFMWVYYTNIQTMQVAQQQPVDQDSGDYGRDRSSSRSRSRSRTPLHD